MIKAVIFDLDDTLFDCGPLQKEAMQRAAVAMVGAGLPCSEEAAFERLWKCLVAAPRESAFEKVCEDFDINEKIKNNIINAAFSAYSADIVGEIKLFPGAEKTLAALRAQGIKLVLITSGSHSRQEKKIEMLGLKKFFDIILIHDVQNGPLKEAFFADALQRLNLNAKDVLSVGDRIYSEIKISNRIGMNTAQMLHGRFSILEPKNEFEVPDYRVQSISDVLDVIEKINKHPLKIVAIGGGLGLPIVLKGLKKYTGKLTAIVTVTDSGRSSGILRKEMNILPPGDIRNCLVALSDSEQLMLDIFSYRFENGGLEGHSFGNLFIAALAKTTGSFERALEEAGKILRIKGQVLPSTLDQCHICAELENGTVIEEENNIIERDNPNVYQRPRIKRVFLKPQAAAFEKAVEAIMGADMIIFSPGSLYTSVISNLLVSGIGSAIKASKAKKIYVCNIMTQQCQTHGYKASDHLKEIMKHTGAIDFILLNSRAPDKSLLQRYAAEHSSTVENDADEIRKLGVEPVLADMLEECDMQTLWKKKDLLRHDPQKLAAALMSLA